jgi:hypothetical protein
MSITAAHVTALAPSRAPHRTGGMMLRLALLALLLALCAPAAWPQTIVRTPITEVEKRKVDAFIAGRDILKISDYFSPELDSIGPIEHLIFRKAVLLGGLDAVFEDLIVPNSARAREAIRSALVVGGGTAHWHDHYENKRADVFESDALIAQDGYEKGLYTTRDKSTTLHIAQLDDLRTLSAVSSETWVVDWRTVKALPLKAVYSAPNRATQFRMVLGGRADFTLQDFSALADMSIEEEGLRLYPVRGVKIALRGSRHFFVSKRHPDGEKVYAAIQKGIRIMRQNGDIERMLAQSGNFNSATRPWILLNKK